MDVIFTILELLLGAMADLEFRLVGERKVTAARRLHLRLLRVEHKARFRFGHSIMIRNRGNLKLGDRCGIGSYARIWNYAPINIGDDFLAAGGLTINSSGHEPVTLAPIGKPVCIGNRVWCGVNVTILSGVSIGDDVVLAAGSVVASDIPPNCIAGGVPAKKLRELNRLPESGYRHPLDDEQAEGAR